MRLKALLKITATSLCLALPLPAYSQGVPTVDATSIAKLTAMLAEARSQLQEAIKQNVILDEQTKHMLQQILLLKQQIAALRDGLSLEALGIGPDFLENILPGISDLKTQLTAALDMDWENLLGGEINGQPTESFVAEFFKNAGITPERVEELSNSEDGTQARIGTQANTSAFLSAAAEASAEDAQKSLERVDQLMRIDTTNLKQAIDLNTRVTGELAIALANIWSMEAAQTIGMGQAGVMDAATAAEEARFIKLRNE